MAVAEFNFRSKILSYDTAMNIIIPNTPPPKNGYKVLWLLHGINQNNTSWCRNSNIERYVKNSDIAVVMPDAFRSFYTNMQSGHLYWDYISQEIPKLVYDVFNFSKRREDNYVCGLSMGGYGAVKLGLNFPERYAYVGSISGALDIVSLIPEKNSQMYAEMRNVFGDEEAVSKSDNNLFVKLEKTDLNNLPPVYLACGDKDFCLGGNKKFYDRVKAKGFSNIELEINSGEHNWEFWDEYIKHFLKKIDENI